MSIISYLPGEMRQAMENMKIDMNNVQEIRIRIGQPVRFVTRNKEILLLSKEGGLFTVNKMMIDNIFSAINEYSLYAYADAIRQGFVTVRGGHRIGFLGQAVIENGKIKSITNISSINIRVSHQVIGVSDSVIGKLYENGQVMNTLIISPPGYGKTTLLRDLIRNISNGWEENMGVSVTVIDERSEIAAMYKGLCGNDLGSRTDVFDNAPKSQGMMLALRIMNPRVMAVDEIGSKEDVEAIMEISRCGCSIIATAHGSNQEDVIRSIHMRRLMEEGVFRRIIIIEKGGVSCVCC